MSVHYVYRIVVDSWPTEDGKPFAAQGFDYWEKVVDAFHAGESIPSWLPDNFGEWVTPPEDEDDPFSGSSSPKRMGHAVAYYEAHEPETGYGGYSHHLLNVPHANRRRRFNKSALTDRLADLRAWGCVARIERAPIGEWEDAE